MNGLKNMIHIYTTGYHLVFKKGENSAICDSMDGFGKVRTATSQLYIEQSYSRKPRVERLIEIHTNHRLKPVVLILYIQSLIMYNFVSPGRDFKAIM